MTQINLEKVTHIYRIEKRKLEIPVLQGINATFTDEDVNFILGPSGSGKSTLLKTIAGYLQPSAGTITKDGQAINEEDVVFLQQNPTLNAFPELTVRENVILQFQAMKTKPDFQKFLAIISKLNLELDLDRKVKSYSMGQIQRIGIALGLLRRNRIKIFDEPTSHLDMHNAKNLISFLTERANSTKEIFIIASHSQELAKNHHFQVLVDGRLVNRSIDEAIEQYLKHRKYFQEDNTRNISGTLEFRAKCSDGILRFPPFVIALAEWIGFLSVQKIENGYELFYDEEKDKPELEIEIPLKEEEVKCVLDLEQRKILVRVSS